MVLLKSLTPLTSHVLLSYLVLGHCTNPLLLLLQGHFSIELGNLLNRIRRLSYLDLHLRAVILLGSSFVEALNILLLLKLPEFFILNSSFVFIHIVLHLTCHLISSQSLLVLTLAVLVSRVSPPLLYKRLVHLVGCLVLRGFDGRPLVVVTCAVFWVPLRVR